MIGYFEYTSLARFKKAYEALEDNTGERIRHAVIVSPYGVRRKVYRYLRRRKIPYVSFVLTRLVKLKKALRYLHKKKFPVMITLKVTRALKESEKTILSEARMPIVVEDETGISDNLLYYRQNKAILYKTKDEDTARSADFLHIACFGEPIYDCHFSDCLGNLLGVDVKENVFFCPKRPKESCVGRLGEKASYFESPAFLAVKEAFEQKQKACESGCQRYGLCMGACPFEKGCLGFHEGVEAADAFLTNAVDSHADLSQYDYATAHVILKDICYGEDFSS